jgi:hypothetical protein
MAGFCWPATAGAVVQFNLTAARHRVRETSLLRFARIVNLDVFLAVPHCDSLSPPSSQSANAVVRTMMVSSLSRAAAAVRVLFALYILSFLLDVAVAAPDAVPRRQPPSPRAHPSRSRLPRSTGQQDGDLAKDTPPTLPGSSPVDSSAVSTPASTPATPTNAPPITVPSSTILMDQEVWIGVTIPENSSEGLVLCQTSQWDISAMTSDNTWAVLPVVFSGECRERPPLGLSCCISIHRLTRLET